MKNERAIEVAEFAAGLAQTGAGSVVTTFLEVERELWNERQRFARLLQASRVVAGFVECVSQECDRPGAVLCAVCRAKDRLAEAQNVDEVEEAAPRQTPDGSFGSACGGPSLDLPVGPELVDENAPHPEV